MEDCIQDTGWNLFARGGSLWVAWVITYLLRGRSLWIVKSPQQVLMVLEENYEVKRACQKFYPVQRWKWL